MKIECPLKSESSIAENNLDLLLDYSAGRLDGEANQVRRMALEDHMTLCSDCSAFRVGQAEVWQALDAWEPEPVSMDFNRRLWQQIDAAAAGTLNLLSAETADRSAADLDSYQGMQPSAEGEIEFAALMRRLDKTDDSYRL